MKWAKRGKSSGSKRYTGSRFAILVEYLIYNAELFPIKDYSINDTWHLPHLHLWATSSLNKYMMRGVPTARNKLSGHGQGPEIRVIPDYMASYVLHLTASTILFLGNAASQWNHAFRKSVMSFLDPCSSQCIAKYNLFRLPGGNQNQDWSAAERPVVGGCF